MQVRKVPEIGFFKNKRYKGIIPRDHTEVVRVSIPTNIKINGTLGRV